MVNKMMKIIANGVDVFDDNESDDEACEEFDEEDDDVFFLFPFLDIIAQHVFISSKLF